MSSRVAYYFATFVVIFTHNVIFPVKGQCTVEGCENGDSAISIAAELKEQVQSILEIFTKSFQQIKNQQDTLMTSLQAVDRRSLEQDIYIKQVQSIHELLSISFQQMKNQQETIMTSLQIVDRRSQNQVQSIQQILNASFLQMKNQQETIMTSLQTVDRRSQEQDIYIKQVRSIRELLNASSQQMNNQHATSMRRFDVVTQLHLNHDISIKNQTQNTWKLAIGLPVQLEVNLGEGPVLLPIVNNWIVLMHRFDGSLNFNRTWTEYRNGFGDIGRGEFWLGNEKVHRLTNTKGTVYTLRIEVYINGTWFYAEYAIFSLDSESNKYTLRLSGFSGNAGDGLTSTEFGGWGYHGGMNFSTWDVDNDIKPEGNCARTYPAGWWFNKCELACLTCPYNNRFRWYTLRHLESSGIGSLRAARMMIKSK